MRINRNAWFLFVRTEEREGRKCKSPSQTATQRIGCHWKQFLRYTGDFSTQVGRCSMPWLLFLNKYKFCLKLNIITAEISDASCKYLGYNNNCNSVKLYSLFHVDKCHSSPSASSPSRWHFNSFLAVNFHLPTTEERKQEIAKWKCHSAFIFIISSRQTNPNPRHWPERPL